jgi:hypothetical protein
VTSTVWNGLAPVAWSRGMRRSMLPLVCAISLAACKANKIQPDVVAANTTTTTTATTTAAPAPAQISPPDPGHVDLVFTGDFATQVKGEGVPCDDGFWMTSADVLGPDAVPHWVLLTADGKLQLQLGPTETARVFDSAKGPSSGLVHTGDRFVFDTALVEAKGKKGTAHVKGTLSCAKPASGTVPDAIAKILGDESQAPVRAGCTHDFGRGETAACVSVVVPGKPEGAARALVARVRKKLPPGWVAFVGTSRWLGAEKHDGAVEVVVGPGRDQLDILRLAQSDAINYGMATEALVKKLRAYDASIGIDIWHAETDTIELDLARLPPDLHAFAKDLYAFCPDIVDQGIGTVEELETAIAETKAVFLWWD